MQLICQIISAYFEDNCADELINDPVLMAVLGKEKLASQPALSRFWNRLDKDTLLQLDAIMVRDHLRPLGMSAGDFDLAVAPDGKAYYYFERVHSETICADLTDDYTDVTGYYSTHFPHPYPPFVREATAHFVRNYKHYLLTSGTTGYLPNPSEVAIGDSWHGPYKVLGDPHVNDLSRTSSIPRFLPFSRCRGKRICISHVRIGGSRR